MSLKVFIKMLMNIVQWLLGSAFHTMQTAALNLHLENFQTVKRSVLVDLVQ